MADELIDDCLDDAVTMLAERSVQELQVLTVRDAESVDRSGGLLPPPLRILTGIADAAQPCPTAIGEEENPDRAVGGRELCQQTTATEDLIVVVGSQNQRPAGEDLRRLSWG